MAVDALFLCQALAVKRVTSNKGKNTAGVDHELWKTPKGKFEAIDKLKRRGYQPNLSDGCTSRRKTENYAR